MHPSSVKHAASDMVDKADGFSGFTIAWGTQTLDQLSISLAVSCSACIQMRGNLASGLGPSRLGGSKLTTHIYLCKLYCRHFLDQKEGIVINGFVNM